MTRCASFELRLQRQTSGLTACADPFRCAMQLSTGRRSPRTATSRGRPPQRRNENDSRTPRKGRLRPGKLQLNPIRCSFHLLPILVYRKGHLCRIPMPLAGRREDGTSRPQHAAEGSPQGQGSLYCTWSRGPGRARGTRCSAFAESSRSCGTT